MLGALLPLYSSATHRNTNSSYQAILAVLSRVWRNWVCHLFVTRTPPPGGANHCCDCDGYRPDTLGGGTGQAESVTSNHSGRRQLLLQIILLTHLKAGFKRGLLPVKL